MAAAVIDDAALELAILVKRLVDAGWRRTTSWPVAA